MFFACMPLSFDPNFDFVWVIRSSLPVFLSMTEMKRCACSSIVKFVVTNAVGPTTSGVSGGANVSALLLQAGRARVVVVRVAPAEARPVLVAAGVQALDDDGLCALAGTKTCATALSGVRDARRCVADAADRGERADHRPR